MEILESFRSPWVVVSALPWVLLLAWAARRLLGAGRVPLRTTLLAGVIGYGAGLGLAVALVPDPDSGAFVTVATVLTVALVMVSIVALELLAARGPVLAAPPRPALPHPARAVRRSLATSRRFGQVTRIAARQGLGSLLGLERGVPGPPGADQASALARRARRGLEEAGGMFVKLGQLLSTRVDLVPPAAARELAGLQEDVTPAPREAVAALLQRELGRPVEAIFECFDWQPLAAASLGQVYAARLPGGREVAVKVQRPGIAEVVERDLAIVRRMARTIESRTSWGRAYGVSGLAAEFAERLREELDYRVEARNAVEVAAGLQGEPRIRVPAVLTDLSTSRVLVTERLTGTSAGQLRPAEGAAAHARAELADVLLRAQLRAMLDGQRFHADPHPGNVFVLTDGTVGLLDLGATGRLDAFERQSVTAMLAALHERDPAALREAVLTVAELRGDVDTYQLDRAFARFMARHLDGGRTPDAAALADVLEVTAEFGITLPASTTTMFRALVTLEGTLLALAPGYRVVDGAQRWARELAGERLAPAAVGGAVRHELVRLAPLLQRAPHHLDRIAALVERGELRMRTRHLSDPHDVAILGRWVDRAVLALIGGMLGTVSALLLLTEAGPTLAGGMPFPHALGYAGLVAGAVLILRVLLAVLQDPHR